MDSGRSENPRHPPAWRPPRWARAVLRRSVDRDDEAFVQGDLEERYRQISQDEGRRAADRWYRRQAITSLPAFITRLAWAAVRSGVWADVRTSARRLVRRPAYTSGVAGTLGLGLASACAVLLVLWKVWLSPLPFPDPGQVARVLEIRLPASDQPPPSGDGGLADGHRLSPPLIEDLRRHDWETITAVSGVSRQTYDWTTDDGTSPVTAIQASPELFDILGWVPALGRRLSRDVHLPEVVLTRAFFAGAFGADPSLIGRQSLTLNGERFRIVGVIDPPGAFPDPADVIAPLAFDEDDLREGMRGARYLDVVARVAPGRTVAEASAELDAFVRALGTVHPNHEGWGARAIPLTQALTAPYRTVFVLLFAAGLSFLALTCVNVAGLVAARRIDGLRDRAVRLALGASKGRLLRHAMIESLLLGLLGGLLGVVGAYWLLSPIRALVPEDVPRLNELALDVEGAAAILAVALLVGLVVGLLGHMSSGRIPDAQKAWGRSPSGWRGRQALVVGQVALTTLLVTGGATTLDEALSLRAVDPGFSPEGVESTFVALSQVQYPDEEASRGFWTQLLDGMEARGIQAAVAVNPPMSGSQMPFGFRTPGVEGEAYAEYHTVSRNYFDVMGIEVLEGRGFGPDDHEGSEAVVIIGEALARERFPEGSAVGRELELVATPRTVVGVVASTHHYGPDQQTPLEVYVPLRQDSWTLGHLLIRTSRADAADVAAELIGTLDPAATVPPVGPY
ncbi:MAG: ABC transporter permease, partial [Gemmatimonadota bacterium]|nr:ABC transporter permease [Gemmatimonadota bacterium]